MRVEELRNVIRDVGGILPALQRLSYAGERLLQACCPRDCDAQVGGGKKPVDQGCCGCGCCCISP
jgi:hypothetical protein